MQPQEFEITPEEENNPLLALCDACYNGDCEAVREILKEKENRYYVNEFLNYDEHMGEVS